MSVTSRLKRAVRVLAGRPDALAITSDMGEAFHALRGRVAPYTMTSPERLFAVHEAARYVTAAQVPGAMVECGVWRGGATMMAALSLLSAGDTSRDLWLYDTFEGMPEPGAEDVRATGEPAAAVLEADPRRAGARNMWAWAALDDVRRNVASTGYPGDRVRYVQGRVEETIPDRAPDQIAVLRLDTDWYESTRHELEHLWDRIVPGGVLLVDDYGYWQGARKAVDEFFADRPQLLHRVDHTGRSTVKP